MKIDDLFTDLADGKMLMKLLEIISGEKIGKPNKGVLRVQKMENVSRCLTFLSTKVRDHEENQAVRVGEDCAVRDEEKGVPVVGVEEDGVNGVEESCVAGVQRLPVGKMENSSICLKIHPISRYYESLVKRSI